MSAGGRTLAGSFRPDATISEYADGMNLYQYVKSRPTFYVDIEVSRGALKPAIGGRVQNRPVW